MIAPWFLTASLIFLTLVTLWVALIGSAAVTAGLRESRFGQVACGVGLLIVALLFGLTAVALVYNELLT